MALKSLKVPKPPALPKFKTPVMKPAAPKYSTPWLSGQSNLMAKPLAARAPGPASPLRGTTPVAGPGSTIRGAAGVGPTVVPPMQQPDYGSLIAGDWEVQNAESDMGARMARARGDFQAALRAQLIDLGLSDTSKLGSLGQYIDEDTIKAAVANKYSATAQTAQQAGRARDVNNASLAARGILSSGQTTKTQQDVSGQAEAANYASLRDFLSQGAQGLSGLGDLESQLASNLAAARAAAAQRAAANDPMGDPSTAIGTNPYGLYNQGLLTGRGPRTGTPQLNYGVPSQLSRGAFMAKNPRGNYANYLQAYRRHLAASR